MMPHLTIPDKNKHRYIVGIDFGHAETSAAICRIEWDKAPAERLNEYDDIAIGPAKSKIEISAVSILDGMIHIGNDAINIAAEADEFRIGFKDAPKSLDGDKERLMTAFMAAAYDKIKATLADINIELTPDNHIVYIARPSGWNDRETKDLYCTMAINAGMPLGGLTSESRAAIFYATIKDKIVRRMRQGIILFDLGSSTLDLTYLANGVEPVDDGRPLGASVVERVILRRTLADNEDARTVYEQYPSCRDLFLHKAREFKEDAYTNPTCVPDGMHKLSKLCKQLKADNPALGSRLLCFEAESADEITSWVNSEEHYCDKLADFLRQFRNDKVGDRPVYGVFMTGGASRMNFLRPCIAQALDLPPEDIVDDGADTSLTISRGIALIGAADAIATDELNAIKTKMFESFDSDECYKKIINSISEPVADQIFARINATCNDWVVTGTTTEQKELEDRISVYIELFMNNELSDFVRKSVAKSITRQSESIRQELANLLRNYNSEYESSVNAPGLTDLEWFEKSESKIVNAVSESVKKVLGKDDSWWKYALAYFLLNIWGVLAMVLIELFGSDRSKRKKIADRITGSKTDFIRDISLKIRENCDTPSLKNSVKKSLEDFFRSFIEKDLNRVKINIE